MLGSLQNLNGGGYPLVYPLAIMRPRAACGTRLAARGHEPRGPCWRPSLVWTALVEHDLAGLPVAGAKDAWPAWRYIVTRCMVAGMAELRESTYFILAALLEGPRHGYGIAQAAAELSGGRVRPSAGTLYGALERLTTEELIQRDREEVVSGRRRRFYRLTGAGCAQLEAEAERMRVSAAVVQTRRSPRSRRAVVEGAV